MADSKLSGCAITEQVVRQIEHRHVRHLLALAEVRWAMVPKSGLSNYLQWMDDAYE